MDCVTASAAKKTLQFFAKISIFGGIGWESGDGSEYDRYALNRDPSPL
jgi:hypothetical protein